MPVLDPERVSTRSTVRYRPLPATDQAQPGPLVALRSRRAPVGVSQVIAWGTGVLDFLHYSNP